MGIRRFAKFSRNARAFACVGNRWSSLKVRYFDDRAWSPPRADDPDRPRPLHDNLFALSISAPLPVGARLVVGPDDVGDVGVGNERYDAMAPSLNGVGTEVDGPHSKSSPGRGFVYARPRAPSAVQAIRPGRLCGHPDARLGRAAESHIVW